MNKLLLRLVALLNPLWNKLGANVPQLMIILRTKLMMDDRRPNAYTQMRAQQKKKKEAKGGSWAIVLMSLLMGIFYVFLLTLGKLDALLPMFVYFCAFMTMLMLTLISDFTYVLIDVKDNLIILPKPVNDRTVLLSRLLHIMIHVSKIVFPMAVPGMVFIAIVAGVLGMLWFFVMVLFASIFSIFMINALYLVVLRFTTPERFKEIINYLQIIFSVLIFAMYYLVPKLVNKATFENVDLLKMPYLSLTPPYWFAGGWVSVTYGKWDVMYTSMLACSLLLPVICLWVVVRYLGPSFNKRLSLVAGSGGETPVKAAAQQKKKLYRKLARWLSNGKTEQLGFEMVWLMTGRSREFKLKVYPSLAYVVVYFAYLMLSGQKGTPAETWRELPTTNTFILLMYISCFAFVTAISNLVYSSRFKSAWIFYSAPLAHPGQVLAGAFKAAMVKFFLPFYLLVSAFVVWVWGLHVIPDLVLGLVNITVLCLLFAFMFLKKFPFSMEMNAQNSGGKIMMSLLVLAIPGAFGALHYFIVGRYLLLGIFFVMSLALMWLVYVSYRDTSWEKIYKV